MNLPSGPLRPGPKFFSFLAWFMLSTVFCVYKACLLKVEGYLWNEKRWRELNIKLIEI